MDWLYAALLGYLAGSVPFGLLLTRLFGAGDLRKIGSGSIGATNVLRTGHKGLAAATVMLDGGIASIRISSVASMTSMVVAPVAAWLFDFAGEVIALVAIAAIVIVQHRANIARLLKGEEPRVGSKS